MAYQNGVTPLYFIQSFYIYSTVTPYEILATHNIPHMLLMKFQPFSFDLINFREHTQNIYTYAIAVELWEFGIDYLETNPPEKKPLLIMKIDADTVSTLTHVTQTHESERNRRLRDHFGINVELTTSNWSYIFCHFHYIE